MTDALTIFFDVQSGELRIEPESRQRLLSWLKTRHGLRGRAIFEATSADKRKRLERLYWKVLREAGTAFGNDPKDQHAQFWRAVTPLPFAPGALKRDLEALTDGELSAYVQAAIRLSAEHGCIVVEKS